MEEKSGLSRTEIESVMDALLARVRVIPADEVVSKWEEAEAVMKDIDENDTPFVAAALGARCDGIWSDDEHLKRQRKVRVWTTKDIVGLGNHS